MIPDGSSSHSRAAPSRSRIAGQWFAILGPLAAAFAHQQLSYALVQEACRRHSTVLVHLPVLVGFVLIGVAWVLARREWERSGRRTSVNDPPEVGSATFFPLVGFAMSGFAAALILAQWLPTFFLDPCAR